MKVSLLAIDLAKDVFQLHGIDSHGKCVLKRKLKRAELSEFVVNLPVCTIAMESCSGAQFWARTFEQFGHTVKLIAPQFVKPFVKTNKNDAADAEAIAEAACRPSMRFVPRKQTWQQDIQCLHRIRERLVKNRTALSNEMRGFLNEFGIVVPERISSLRQMLPSILEDGDNELSILMRDTLLSLLNELSEIDKRVLNYEKKILAIFKSNEACQRIYEIQGVGPLTSTAVVAAVGDPKVFKNGRQFAAWLGLVPRQHSSGGKNILLGISKRGDVYLRSLLIHGARSAIRYASKHTDRKSVWVTNKADTRGYNKAAVALANKNARIIWAILAKGTEYKAA